MKKIVAVVLVLMVLLNVMILWPKPSAETETEECSLSNRPTIELTEVNPGILPNLLKSTSSGF